MTNVTYLFGAGASCPTLPVVADFGKSLAEFSEVIGKPIRAADKIDGYRDVTVGSARQELLLAIKDLIKKSKDHASIDTYAKKLFIREDEDSKLLLKRLKVILSLFFSYKQSIPGPHYRYDSFFASILQRSINDLPSNIKILSWNYDSQFELAFRGFSGLSLEENQKRLGVISKFRSSQIDKSKFSIIKINGTAAFHSFLEEKQSYSYDDLFKGDTLNLNRYYTEKYYKGMHADNYHCELSFAWEDDPSPNREKKIWEIANSIISDTDILVVIGYSFPIFNRTIDKEILKDIRPKRVYFQSNESKKIIERFQSINSKIPERELIPKDDVYQFLLPEELDIGPPKGFTGVTLN